MLAFVIVAVFISGLMVGRTPEYLGKKIEAYEMKMASLMLLIPILLAKVGTAIAVVAPAGLATIWNTGGPHGFSEVLYAFSSAANNNGSAFAGLGANNPFYNTALGICMFFARYWLIVPALAIAGSLVQKKKVPASCWNFAHAYTIVRCLADRCHHDRRRAELYPRAGIGTDCRAPDGLCSLEGF